MEMTVRKMWGYFTAGKRRTQWCADSGWK